MYLSNFEESFYTHLFLVPKNGKGLKIWVTCSLDDHKQQILDDFNTLPNTAGTWRPLKPNFKTSVKSRPQTIQYPPINHPLNLQALCCETASSINKHRGFSSAGGRDGSYHQENNSNLLSLEKLAGLHPNNGAPRSQIFKTTNRPFALKTDAFGALKFHFRLATAPRQSGAEAPRSAAPTQAPARSPPGPRAAEGPDGPAPAAAFRCARAPQPIACSPAPRGRGEAGAGKRKKNIRPPPTSARAAAAAAPGSRTLTFHWQKQ